MLNLTQYEATKEQREQGVIEPSTADKEAIKALLTFDEIPTYHDIRARAITLAEIAERYNVKYAMIGGAPYLMSSLERALASKGIIPLYAFTKRVAEEEKLPDGSVVKKTVFKHLGFVLVW